MSLGMLNKNNQVKRRVQVSRGALPPRSGAGRHDSALRWLPLAVHLISGTGEAPRFWIAGSMICLWRLKQMDRSKASVSGSSGSKLAILLVLT